MMTASLICKNCGLCCDGTLFDHAKLDNPSLFKSQLEKSGKSDYLEANSLTERFAIPCPFYTGQCSIYSERPAICQKFMCQGIKKWESSSYTTDELMDIINQIKLIKEAILTLAGTIPEYKKHSISALRSECYPIIKPSIQAFPDLVLKIGLLIKANSKLHIPKSGRH